MLSVRSFVIWLAVGTMTGIVTLCRFRLGRMKANEAILLPILMTYLSFVLTITVFQRDPSQQIRIEWMPFWSYRAILRGSIHILEEVFWNVVLFVPIGAILSVLFADKVPGNAELKWVCVTGFFLSAGIEVVQLITRRGLFEFDDIFHNTLGTCAGYFFCQVTWAQICRYEKTIVAATAVLICFVFLMAVLMDHKRTGGVRADDTSKYICFQVDKAAIDDDRLVLIGFAFSYAEGAFGDDVSIRLRPMHTGGMLEMAVEYGLERPEVNDYFLCDIDYTDTGFRATVPLKDMVEDEEYEIQVDDGTSTVIYDDVYITGLNIHYSPEGEFIPPAIEGTDLEAVVREGTLRGYRPDRFCWVYQYDGFLYWIADEGFEFESDGTTYIQYQLYTTQIEKLPQKRLENEWYWDNIGGLFEDYEITNEIDCGKYRVCKRKLPTEYAIKSIGTGYFTDHWIWIDCFRPLYDFER